MDNREFEKLFKSEIEVLHRFAELYVKDWDTAMDICQRVFIKLWEKRDHIDPTQSVKSYVYTSVRNQCLNHIRDNKKFRSRILDLDCGEVNILSSRPDDSIELSQLQNKIDQALMGLPTKCRKVFEMSRFQHMKYKEIAEELDISQKTVEAHMSKALKFLRAQLKDEFLLLIALAWIYLN